MVVNVALRWDDGGKLEQKQTIRSDNFPRPLAECRASG